MTTCKSRYNKGQGQLKIWLPHFLSTQAVTTPRHLIAEPVPLSKSCPQIKHDNSWNIEATTVCANASTNWPPKTMRTNLRQPKEPNTKATSAPISLWPFCKPRPKNSWITSNTND